ncbi:MAG: HNH endonuclease [Elusimicrobia bacterium]|nr:HNH endonuclease [Elusimicrobiota bacterium]
MAALLDVEDLEWARQWKWGAVHSRLRFSGTEKWYARRTWRGTSIYLHLEVLARARGPAPTRRHVIGDHRNGDSLDCRRINLRWATQLANNRNLRGRMSAD